MKNLLFVFRVAVAPSSWSFLVSVKPNGSLHYRMRGGWQPGGREVDMFLLQKARLLPLTTIPFVTLENLQAELTSILSEVFTVDSVVVIGRTLVY